MWFFSERENIKLAAENADLEIHSRELEDAIQGHLLPTDKAGIDAETPVDKMLNLLNRLVKVNVFAHSKMS